MSGPRSCVSDAYSDQLHQQEREPREEQASLGHTEPSHSAASLRLTCPGPSPPPISLSDQPCTGSTDARHGRGRAVGAEWLLPRHAGRRTRGCRGARGHDVLAWVLTVGDGRLPGGGNLLEVCLQRQEEEGTETQTRLTARGSLRKGRWTRGR